MYGEPLDCSYSEIGPSTFEFFFELSDFIQINQEFYEID